MNALKLAFLSVFFIIHQAQADTLSVMFSVDGNIILNENGELGKDQKFGYSTPEGYRLFFEVRENEQEVAIKSSIFKNNYGELELLAEPFFITQWNHSAVLTMAKHDSSAESLLSLKVMPQKHEHVKKKSLLRNILDKIGQACCNLGMSYGPMA